MTYHEYATPTGTAHRHYNGRRITGGATLAELFETQRVKDASWEAIAKTELITLLDTVGRDAYNRWIDALPDSYTWQQYYNAAAKALEQIENDECACCLPDHTCPICQQKARLYAIKAGIDPDRIPF